MDTKKIGAFLKALRKERGLTQEQLAETLCVSGRTISRWETGTNMPDLSILIQIAEFYDVDMKEILDGERKGENMDKELKETLSKVADYSKLEKQKAAKIGNLAFSLSFAACAVILVVQLLITGNLWYVAGETAVLLVGGAAYLGLMSYNGIMKMGADASQTVSVALLFFAGISIAGFGVLRILAQFSHKRKEKILGNKAVPTAEQQTVFVADGNMQADRIISALKENGIMAYGQDLGDAGFAAVRYGMGRGIDDRIAIIVASENEERAKQIIKEIFLA